MKIKLAEHIIEINPLYSAIEDYCKNYVVSDEFSADLTVAVSEKEVLYEQTKSDQENALAGLKPSAFSMPYLETLAVYRKIAEAFPLRDIMLFHGSAIAVDGKAYLFTAKSGTGKSTHTRLWRQMLGERAIMVNDDKPLLRISDQEAIVYGTPWNGKHCLDTNISVPLKAIIILERGLDNQISEISFSEAFPMLLQQSYRPSDAQAFQKTLELISRMKSSVRFFKLKCNMDPAAAKAAYEALSSI